MGERRGISISLKWFMLEVVFTLNPNSYRHELMKTTLPICIY